MAVEELGAWEEVNLSGVTRNNKDGSSRQDELRRLRDGDPVELVREPDNPADPNAILVTTEQGVGIGYIPAAIAKGMAPILDQPGAYDIADIAFLAGGTEDKPNIGAWVDVTILRSLKKSANERQRRGESAGRKFADRPSWQRLLIVGGWIFVGLAILVAIGPD